MTPIPAAAVEAACLSYESAAIAEGYEPVSSRGTYQMRAWMTAALTAALPHLPAPSQPADAVRGLADMLDPAKQADTLRRAADALREGGRDREADRALFPDAAFNDWLDCVITDCGHTVYDSIGCIADAWQGWHAHVVHLMVNDPASVDIGIFEAGVGPDWYVREGIED